MVECLQNTVLHQSVNSIYIKICPILPAASLGEGRALSHAPLPSGKPSCKIVSEVNVPISLLSWQTKLPTFLSRNRCMFMLFFACNNGRQVRGEVREEKEGDGKEKGEGGTRTLMAACYQNPKDATVYCIYNKHHEQNKNLFLFCLQF